MSELKVLIGKNYILLNKEGFERKISWKDIVGINSHFKKSEIYLKNGERIKLISPFVVFNNYNVYDYGENEVGIGKPKKITSWCEIFHILKKYIKKRGNIYINELESLNNSWRYFFFRYFETSCNKYILSKEEKKDIALIAIGVVFSLILFIFAFLILILKGRIENETIGWLTMAYFLILWFYWMFLVLYTKRNSKLLKILKRHGAYKPYKEMKDE